MTFTGHRHAPQPSSRPSPVRRFPSFLQEHKTFWNKIKNSLVLILADLDTTFHDVECDRDEFSPLLTVHPPALRSTRRDMIESQMEDVSAAWDQVLHVEARILELKEELKKRRVMRLSTTRSPVFALPVEILREVFFYIGVRDTEMEPSPTPVNLVCRHWHAIAAAMSSVSLHAVLPSGQSIESIIPSLCASNPRPVHLTVEAPQHDYFPDEATMNLCGRLESLAWNVAEDLDEFLRRLAMGEEYGWLKSLHTLTVKGSGDCTFSEDTQKFDWPVVDLEMLGGLPKLTTLNIEKAVASEYLTSNTLTSLILSTCTLHGSDFEAIVRGTPNLKLLSISELQSQSDSCEPYREPYRPSLDIFVQSSLERIAIHHVWGEIKWICLYSGRYPNLRSLSICNLSPTARPSLYPAGWLPPHSWEGGPLERSFYHTVSRNQLVWFGVPGALN